MMFLLMKPHTPVAKPKPKTKLTPKPKPKIKTKSKMSLRTKIKIAAAGTIIGGSLLAGNITRNAVTNFQKDRLTNYAFGNHLSAVTYPKGRENIIKTNLKKLNEKSKLGEIYFWDSKDQKVSRITVDPIKMKNIFTILEYKDQIKEIEEVLKEAGGQIWDKYFLSKPIGEIYKDLTPSQVQRLEKVVKQLPTAELEYIQREANLWGTLAGVGAGAGVGIKSALLLSTILAKIKIGRRKRK